MKKMILFLAVLAITSGVYAADPTDILVKDDSDYVGTYIEDAITALWPAANVTVISNTLTGFQTELEGGTAWDIVVMDNFMTGNIGSDAGLTNAIATYYTDGGKLFYVSWSAKYGNETPILGAMGVTYNDWLAASPWPDHYGWDAAHDIATTPNAITDWAIEDYGIGKNTWGIKFTIVDAVPVTGWVASETDDEAALCVANDGYGVISGMFPYSLGGSQQQALMENILTFMWADVASIKSASLGEIKATFK